jgi:hypothetical protein
MVILGRMFPWHDALVNVKPDTFLRWHRQGFPSILALEIKAGWQTSSAQRLALTHPRMAAEDPTWGEGALPTSCSSS